MAAQQRSNHASTTVVVEPLAEVTPHHVMTLKVPQRIILPVINVVPMP
jgi:hypothetical protein